MFQYLHVPGLSNLASSDLAGGLAAVGFYMSETIITSHTHAFFWRAHMCDRHGRGKEQESR